MRKDSILCSLVFLTLLSPSIFNFELWPLSRYNLYSNVRSSPNFRFFGIFATLESGQEIYLNPTSYLAPLNAFDAASRMIKKSWDLTDFSETERNTLRRKLRSYLQVLNANLGHINPDERAVKLSLYQMYWENGSQFHTAQEGVKKELIAEVMLDTAKP